MTDKEKTQEKQAKEGGDRSRFGVSKEEASAWRITPPAVKEAENQTAEESGDPPPGE